jgi:hypothetical protein
MILGESMLSDLIKEINKLSKSGKILVKKDGSFYTRGSLDLSQCTSLKILPDNLTVDGDLNLRECKGLESLPDNLKVSGDLNLVGCTSLESLPDNLKVGGDLYLSGCTLLPFDKSKFNITGNYEISSVAVDYIMNDFRRIYVE